MRAYKILSISVVILLITVVFVGAVPAAAQTDTMQWRYDASHSGDYSPVAGRVPSNGQLKWKFTTGGAIVESSPAVANGVVYVGSNDSNVYALNATTGAKVWNFTAGSGVAYSSPAVVNGVVYIGGDNIYALNATTGAKLWNYTTGGEALTVANGVVYIAGDGVYALNATTGAKLWNYTTGSEVDYSSQVYYSSPAVANGVVYVGTSFTLAGCIIPPCIAGNVLGLNASTGASTVVLESLNSYYSPAVVNGVVYGVTSYVFTSNVYAMGNGAGWSSPTVLGTESPPAVSNGVVYVGDFSGNVSALNATTGTKLWNYTTGNLIESSPTTSNGTVYVGSDDGNVYALNANNGTKLWNYTTGGAVSSSPAVANGVVYVGSDDGNVYAIGNESISKQTSLTASAPSTASTNQNFTINGTLNTTAGTPIAGATIQLQKNVSGSWQSVTGKTNTTTSTGAYRISTSEPAVGTYQYRTTYAGNATYDNATSTVVSVQVNKIPTQLSAAINLTVAAVNMPFTINGTLNTTTGTPVAGATIQLQKNVSGTWTNIAGKTNTTTSTGAYRISTSESKAGTYQYRTTYAGNATYANATSNAVSVVTTITMPTSLTLTLLPTHVTVEQNFVLSGMLTAGGTGVAYQTVHFYAWNGLTWIDTTATANTNLTGWYSLTGWEPNPGTYVFLTKYLGSPTYSPSTAPNYVQVVVKATTGAATPSRPVSPLSQAPSSSSTP